MAELSPVEERRATAVTPQPTQHGHPLFRSRLRDMGSRFGILLVWLIIIIVFSILQPATFFTLENLQTIFGSEAVLLVLALGLIVSLTAGEIDLSISGVTSVSLVLVGQLNVNNGWPIGWAVVAALLVGVLVGIIHAALIVGLGLESIVVTLGTGTLLTGTGFGINYQTTSGISMSLVNVVRTSWLGIPLVFYYGLALTFALWYVYRYTPLGRYLYVVGANRNVARLSGLRVNAIRSGALITTSVVCALTGVFLAGNLGSADPNTASGYLLPAFASAFLGSTAITPGRFNPWGAFVAVYFLVTGITGLNLLGYSGWVEDVFYGGSLVLAVIFSKLVGRRQTA